MTNTETKYYRIHMKTEYFKIEDDSLVLRVPAGVEINEEILMNSGIGREDYFIINSRHQMNNIDKVASVSFIEVPENFWSDEEMDQLHFYIPTLHKDGQIYYERGSMYPNLFCEIRHGEKKIDRRL